MKKPILYFFGILIPMIIIIILLSGANKKVKASTADNQFLVQRDNFEICVMTTGELQATTAEFIQGPQGLQSRNLRFGDIQISELIIEGTVVAKGDFVAQLDKTDADNTLKDILDQVDAAESALLQIKLDTTIQLTDLRGQIQNLKFSVDEAKISLEQSIYEPPATIRQAEINLDKTQRGYEQALRDYNLKILQLQASVREAEINLEKVVRQRDEMLNILEEFTIYAPAPGMVIYYRQSDGTKRNVGSNINQRDLTIAELPDLNRMTSITYINEIDINQVRIGQKVIIGTDAFPDKKLSGSIVQISNVGQQLPNTDAKVFEVLVNLLNYDPELKPSMTTSNKIITNTFDNVLFIPIQAIHSEDGKDYVYDVNGEKREVILGLSDETHIIIKEGIKEGDIIQI